MTAQKLKPQAVNSRQLIINNSRMISYSIGARVRAIA